MYVCLVSACLLRDGRTTELTFFLWGRESIGSDMDMNWNVKQREGRKQCDVGGEGVGEGVGVGIGWMRMEK